MTLRERSPCVFSTFIANHDILNFDVIYFRSRTNQRSTDHAWKMIIGKIRCTIATFGILWKGTFWYICAFVRKRKKQYIRQYRYHIQPLVYLRNPFSKWVKNRKKNKKRYGRWWSYAWSQDSTPLSSGISLHPIISKRCSCRSCPFVQHSIEKIKLKQNIMNFSWWPRSSISKDQLLT